MKVSRRLMPSNRAIKHPVKNKSDIIDGILGKKLSQWRTNKMSFNIGNTTFGFTMRVPASDETGIDDLIASHASWMSETHSLNPEEGKLHTLEYYVSKATELNDMMDPSKGSTGNIIYTVSEVHIDDEHFGKHVELGQSWSRIGEFFELFEKYSPLVTMAGRVSAKL